MENREGPRLLRPTARFPVYNLFNSKYNGHFYEPMKHSDCHFVIDGSEMPHRLWKLNPHWKLSDESQFAVIVENFFRSFERAKITVHVLFLRPTKDIGNLACGQNFTVTERIHCMNTSCWKQISSMQSRIIFGEVMKALKIHHFFVGDDGHETMASYAKSIDATMISANNFFFLADLPRGYLHVCNLSTEQLRYGLMEIAGLTYFREKFLRSIRFVETDKMKSIALFATLIESRNAELLEEFHRAKILKYYAAVDGVNCPKGSSIASYLAQHLLFVTDKSFDDARLRVLSHMYPNARELFKESYEDNYRAFASRECVSYEDRELLPELRSYLEVALRARQRMKVESVKKESSYDGESSEEESDDDSVPNRMLPGWFKDTVLSEAPCGYFGRKLQYLVSLLGTGSFYPVHHLQDPDDYSACFSSLRVRKVLYGILFQDCRKQLLEEENQDAIKALRIKEHAVIRGRIFRLRIEPAWWITDAAKPQKALELPSLLEMENLDLATRKRIFSVAMVGDSRWLETLGHDAHNYEYNLLLLRSWAKRSPNLQKIHVTVLLLTILAIEAKYDKKTSFFPWPISFREGVVLRCPPQSAMIRYKCLQPFAQLQTVTDIAFYLNFSLNSPHGLRVDRVREFYSEIFFHNLLSDWSLLNEAEQTERLASLFENDCLEKFLSLVNALYGDENESERAPLYLVSSDEGLPSDEILGKAHDPIFDLMRRLRRIED